jgi:transcription-repair coupling factor (superfamily II helicase)
VRIPGEFSWRGGILDLYSPVYDHPVRLDYFGDELESIRVFDPVTQRSLEPLQSCRIIPRGEHIFLEKQNSTFDFLDYFNCADVQLVVADSDEILHHLDVYADADALSAWQAAPSKAGAVRYIVDRHAAHSNSLPLTKMSAYALDQFRGVAGIGADEPLRAQFLAQQTAHWLESGCDVVFCSPSDLRRSRFLELVEETPPTPKADQIHVAGFDLQTGAYLSEQRLVLLSEAEVFGRPLKKKPRRRTEQFSADHLLHSGLELSVNDFAVHAAYGVCQFLGLDNVQFQGRRQEVLVLEFQQDKRVYVPLDQAYLIGRYVGAGKKAPRLSRIGGARWKRVKADAELAVNDLAAELIRIQAVRQTAVGTAYVSDLDEHAYAQFVEAFPYTETADQLDAADAVIADLEAARPMDRLICGDVGFGKTEVAMRAAFKVVLGGRQAAILAPTTVLVQQHFLTFQERFRDFPVVIRALSRFQTIAEVRQTLHDLHRGKVDIVIGTHRLLSGDVHFNNLGLIVIDEEQRFGVKHKEKLKRLRASVDVMTMTATPIPRTLYLSMAGLRDMSTIMSPPSTRLPVQTVVAQYDETMIREAIRRELQRGGQVFYLSNRVKTIDKVAAKMKKLVPEASVDIGHGQMNEHDLEAAMLRFIQGDTDVLVCTTIIESGMDIPNANTIIIERADRFGLADLYQLRGRVGRHDRQAYAYLLIEKYAVLLDVARERLSAIRKYTKLGAGFKLAVRDLELRGAGNLLGAEQSGHITAVGLDLYCKLLTAAVARMKKTTAEQHSEVDVLLDFCVHGAPDEAGDVMAACFSHDFIAEEELRVDCYRRLSSIRNVKGIDAFREELLDRFGVIPEDADNLLRITAIKRRAAAAGIHAISVKNRCAYLETERGPIRKGAKLPMLRASAPAAQLSELEALVETLI